MLVVTFDFVEPTPGQRVTVYYKDPFKGVHVGSWIESNADRVKIKDAFGVVEIKREEIKKITTRLSHQVSF